MYDQRSKNTPSCWWWRRKNALFQNPGLGHGRTQKTNAKTWIRKGWQTYGHKGGIYWIHRNPHGRQERSAVIPQFPSNRHNMSYSLRCNILFSSLLVVVGFRASIPRLYANYLLRISIKKRRCKDGLLRFRASHLQLSAVLSHRTFNENCLVVISHGLDHEQLEDNDIPGSIPFENHLRFHICKKLLQRAWISKSDSVLSEHVLSGIIRLIWETWRS